MSCTCPICGEHLGANSDDAYIVAQHCAEAHNIPVPEHDSHCTICICGQVCRSWCCRTCAIGLHLQRLTPEGARQHEQLGMLAAIAGQDYSQKED